MSAMGSVGLGRCRPTRLAVMVLALGLLQAACRGEAVALKDRLEVVDVTTGWFDAGIVNGKNKLVPTISFSLRNSGSDDIHGVQLNAVFRRVGEDDEWGNAFTRGIGLDGLAPGATTPPIVLRSELGYTGEQPRAQMLAHSQFVDARVLLFAKHGSAQWTPLTETQIARQLLTR